ncbi:MAG: transglutaminase-like domain-containing protein [Candidatus Woesearchaeota archaeon]|nr:transglutaminase-like domain-containing protein [Candidatus Woesearchaeota archaeon]
MEQISFANLGKGQIIAKNTLDLMKKIIISSSSNWQVRQATAKIIEGLPWRDENAELRTIYQWVQENTRYVKDPHTLETLITPPTILNDIQLGNKPQMDCDDYSMLLASMYRSIGYPISLRVASYHPSGQFGHVYILVKTRGTWIPVDGIAYGKEPGWESPGFTNMADYIIDT